MSGIFLTSVIALVFLSLTLGNIVPVYSIDNHTKHGANMSMQNQQNANIEEHVCQSIIHPNPMQNKLWHHAKMMTNIVL